MAKKNPPGKKRCVHCNALIGARCATCPKCNRAIPPKNKPQPKPAGSALDALKAEAKEIESLITDVANLKERLKVLNRMIKELEDLK